MAKRRFTAANRVSLSFVGTGWENAYVDVSIPSYGAIRQLASTSAETDTERADAMLTLVQDQFVSGKAPVGEVMVDLTAEDIADLPVTAFERIVQVVTAKVPADPNSPAPSNE
jgi:hypothetical protein